MTRQTGDLSLSSYVQVIEFDDGSGSVLRIQPLRSHRDEAIYECTATNSVGEINTSAKLTVLEGETPHQCSRIEVLSMENCRGRVQTFWLTVLLRDITMSIYLKISFLLKWLFKITSEVTTQGVQLHLTWFIWANFWYCLHSLKIILKAIVK